MDEEIKLQHSEDKKFHFNNEYFLDPQLYDHISLYQIGDLSCNSGYTISSHKQYCYEISYIVSGKGYYYTNGVRHAVKEGDIYLNLPGETHDGVADIIDPFRFFYVGFNFNDGDVEQNPFAHIQKMFDKVTCPVVHDVLNIKAYFINFFQEIINAKSYSNVMIKAFLHQIIVTAYRNYFERWERDYSPEKTVDNTKQIIYQLVNFIDNHICEIDKLELVTEKLGYSYSYLSHIFSRETGLTIQKYFNRRRFEIAVEWLRADNVSITGIAARLQYQSIHSFSKAFKKYLGISPTQYQQMCKNKQKMTNQPATMNKDTEELF